MKRAKCFLVFGVFVVSLTSWAAPPPFEEPLSWLWGHPHPALSGIDALQVVVVPSGDQRVCDSAFWGELAGKVEQKLKHATIKIPDPNQTDQASKPFDMPEFAVHVDVRHFDGEQMFLAVRTGLARPVYVAMREAGSKELKPGSMVMAAVWTEASAIMPATSEHVREVISRQTLEQADAFIAAWVASNRSERKVLSSEATTVEKEVTGRPVDSTPAERQYVASKNSKVFHSPGCSSVKRISPENLTAYKTRDEAVSAGKRACKLCKP
jgi:hypothetical protein